MKKLNSYDEWTTLREVIVGSAKNYTSHEKELSFDIFFHENIYKSDWAYPRLKKMSDATTGQRKWQIKQRYVDELNEDVENFADVLKKQGIIVHRPMEMNEKANSISSLTWEAEPLPALNIRDNTLILGDEIIETPPAIRSRYLETRLLSKIFYHYHSLGSKWVTMPRPLLNDTSFDLSYNNDLSNTLGGPTEPISKIVETPFDIGFEIILDGAQCIRLGRDIIVNVANENHNLGFNWLNMHYGHLYRFHKIYRLSDNHIDSMILPLRPGVFLARHPGIIQMMPDEFKNWKYIIPPEPQIGNFPIYDDGDLVLTSPYIDMNVLSLSHENIIVNEACKEIIHLLEKEKFNVIPVRHRHRRLFGGGFHCFTLDTVRDGGLEDYT